MPDRLAIFLIGDLNCVNLTPESLSLGGVALDDDRAGPAVQAAQIESNSDSGLPHRAGPVPCWADIMTSITVSMRNEIGIAIVRVGRVAKERRRRRVQLFRFDQEQGLGASAGSPAHHRASVPAGKGSRRGRHDDGRRRGRPHLGPATLEPQRHHQERGQQEQGRNDTGDDGHQRADLAAGRRLRSRWIHLKSLKKKKIKNKIQSLFRNNKI